MTSKVPLKVKPASRGVCVMMTWDGVPAQLKNDETFVLPCAAFNLNVERAVTLLFHECEDKTRESRRTPQTETADPCRGCISHLKRNVGLSLSRALFSGTGKIGMLVNTCLPGFCEVRREREFVLVESLPVCSRRCSVPPEVSEASRSAERGRAWFYKSEIDFPRLRGLPSA